MIKFLIAIFLTSATCFLDARPTVECICKYADPLDDPKLSVAAKALWVAIISQEPLEDGESYFDDLNVEDVFYAPLCELKRKGYL